MANTHDFPSSRLNDLQIEYLHPNLLIPYPANARLHPPRQLSLLEANMRTFGFVVPVLIDNGNGLLAGHARLEVAKRIGLERVPCIRVEHLTEPQKRAYIIADNRLPELATWKEAALKDEFRFLDIHLEFGWRSPASPQQKLIC